ncbi:MAG: hypothetical protein ABR947_00745 [Solirubrobacteraceae bacterium]|jgi:hypothetical protein
MTGYSPQVAYNGAHDEAEAAVAVAECGLASWRAAKAAWLDSFAAFIAQEDAASTALATQR